MDIKTKIIELDNGYNLWTKNYGKSDIHLLMVHGGPGDNHEYFEAAYEELKKQGLDVTVHMYDQLGSWYSDTPDLEDKKIRDKILTYDYFLDEIEEVRNKLGIDNFYLLGHSWGGLLTQLYSRKYGDHLKGIIISSMVSDIDDYTDNLKKIMKKEFSTKQLALIKKVEENKNYDNPEYKELVDILYKKYIDRKQPVEFSHLINTSNSIIYNTFQGDNEFIISGKLSNFHETDKLKEIKVPTLITFGEHETMPIDVGKKMSNLIPNAKFVTTPNGGHDHMVDNPNIYYKHLANFIKNTENL